MKSNGNAQGEAAGRWRSHYAGAPSNERLYPTEWVVRTLAGGNYPHLHLDRNRYPGARILDMSTGDGRNLGLLRDLGFEVHATEISPEIVAMLEGKKERMGWQVELRCGRSDSLPYPDRHFDYLLACASCYYLNGNVTFDKVLAEMARVLKPGGFLIASIPDAVNSVAQDAVPQADGSVVVVNDPFGLRNGERWMIARNVDALRGMLSPHFSNISVGYLVDDYYGLMVSGYIFVCQKT